MVVCVGGRWGWHCLCLFVCLWRWHIAQPIPFPPLLRARERDFSTTNQNGYIYPPLLFLFYWVRILHRRESEGSHERKGDLSFFLLNQTSSLKRVGHCIKLSYKQLLSQPDPRSPCQWKKPFPSLFPTNLLSFMLLSLLPAQSDPCKHDFFPLPPLPFPFLRCMEATRNGRGAENSPPHLSCPRQQPKRSGIVQCEKQRRNCFEFVHFPNLWKFIIDVQQKKFPIYLWLICTPL